MKRIVPAVFVSAAFLLGAVSSGAQHSGGGHSGRFAGRSSGHSFGHSFGHFVGHSSAHGKGSARASGKLDEPQLAREAMIHGRMASPPTPGFHVPPANRFHRPLVEFGFAGPRGFSTFSQGFVFGFCTSFGGFPTRHFFGRDFDCFGGGFLADPFFFGAFFPGLFEADEMAIPPEARDDDRGDFGPDNMDAMQEFPGSQPLSEANPPLRESPKLGPTTLLQLKDGSMYGLTDYHVEGDVLRYTTDYGGKNSVPLSRIDLDKTNQLNSDRGMKFSVPTATGRR